MFNIGASELLIILVVALLLLGPKRLPELARGIGKFVREFRRQTDEVRSVVEREFYRMDQDEAQSPVSPKSMPGPKPALKPLSFPYRNGPEIRPALGAAGPKMIEAAAPEGSAGPDASEAPTLAVAPIASPEPPPAAPAGPPEAAPASPKAASAPAAPGPADPAEPLR